MSCKSIVKNRIEASLVHVVREECGKVVTIIFPEAENKAKLEIEAAQASGKCVSWERLTDRLIYDLVMVG